MAAVPRSLNEISRSDSSSSQKRSALSHGRGGAGNMGPPDPSAEPVNLETPTLKGEMYTTGRGGSGNMAKNDMGEEARRAQDVVGQPRRESGNTTHVGRGGAANVFKPSPAELEKMRKDGGNWETAVGDDRNEDGGEVLVGSAGFKREDTRSDADRSKGLADRGKEWIMGKLGK
ncbi:hypothetical protein LZ554_002186 [Drepanopeziza brunnea f. sp. 'monogermtubi']|nr:hypothetical protein LZ554_002186 [Drepanopeziza brunnea f. sp. 'monogermtubi']